jgi:hypothetical protein
MSPLEDLWSDLEALGKGLAHRRVDAVHPLDFYVGLDANKTRELVLVADDVPPGVARRFRAFEVTSTKRTDGRDSLSVRLRRPELARLFAHLCDDLVEASRHSTRADAVRFVAERIARWESLLSRDREGLLDEQALRGLVAELVFLRDIAIPEKGCAEALHAWRGPLGASHDFQFATLALEVKSVTESLIAVISSADQLDASGERLYLSAIRLHATTETLPPAFSVAALVESLRQLFAPTASLSVAFADKLSLVGYRDAPEYANQWFVVKEIRHYEVNDRFPRLVPTMLHSGIAAVIYDINLRLCEPYRRSTVF